MIEVNQIVGRHYRILQRLGAGGMGQVFKALDVNLGREVAIKFLLEELEEGNELALRFLNEGRILATVNHPAIITVYASEMDEETHRPFLVMEYCNGVSLDRRREDLRAQPQLLLRLFSELLGGIHACHQRGIIHRDLKPANVLVDGDNALRIVDFGIAKMAQKQTRTGVALGTPHYMSPEQCLGKADITGKADVYSTAVMLWEIVSGALPFDIGTNADDPALAIALMHLNEKPDLTRLRGTPLGTDLSDLLDRMLAKKPADRPEIPDIIARLRQVQEKLNPSLAPKKTGADENTFADIYRIEKTIDESGLGRVYKAHDTTLNRPVAIKVLSEEAARVETTVEQFMREGQILATVGHPNVVNIFAAFKDRTTGLPTLVMEFIDGSSLAKLKSVLLKDRSRLVPLLLQLCEGIEACHQKGIIHRALNPQNLLVTREGVLKVIDFGIAQEEINVTRTGATDGTAEYLSPEQCQPGGKVTEKADVYAIGVICWELIYGSPPFQADQGSNSSLSVADKHLNATLPGQLAIPDASLAPLLPLVRQMLDKDPATRPEIGEIIDAFEEHLEAHPTQESESALTRRRSNRMRTSGVRELLQPEVASRPLRTFLGALALIVALGAGGWWLFSSSSRHVEEQLGRVRSALAAGDFAMAHTHLFPLTSIDPTNPALPDLRRQVEEGLVRSGQACYARGDLERAMAALDLAVQLRPGVASVAAFGHQVRTEYQARRERESRLAALVAPLRGLLERATPASGTDALANGLADLVRAGFASPAAQIEQDWIAAFLRRGDDSLGKDPALALAYFREVERRFRTVDGLPARIASAQLLVEERQRRDLQGAERARLRAKIDAGLASLTATTDLRPLLADLATLRSQGDDAVTAACRVAYEKRIQDLVASLSAIDKEKARGYLEHLRIADPVFPQLDERMAELLRALQAERDAAAKAAADKAAADRLAAEKAAEQAALGLTAAQAAARKADLRKKIEADLAAIQPPASCGVLLGDLARLADEFAEPGAAKAYRATLFGKFHAAALRFRASDPAYSVTLLQGCRVIDPAAPGLAEELAGLEAEVASAAATLQKQADLAKWRKEAETLARNPQPKKAETFVALLESLETAGAADQATELRGLALEALKKKAGQITVPAELTTLREWGVKYLPGSGEFGAVVDQAQAKVREKRVETLQQALSSIKPGANLKSVPAQLQELGELDQKNLQTALAKGLEEKFLAEAEVRRKVDPRKALSLLEDAGQVPALKKAPAIQAKIRELTDFIAAQNTPEVITQKLEAELDPLLTGETVEANAAKITQIIARMEKEGDPKKAAFWRAKGSDLLLGGAEGALVAGRIPEAERLAGKAALFLPTAPRLLGVRERIAKAKEPPPPPVTPPIAPPATPTGTPAGTSPDQPPPPKPADGLVVGGADGLPSLAAALGQAKAGMTIRIRPGTYEAGITVAQDVTLIGEGAAGQVILQSSAKPVLTLSSGATVTNLTLRFTGSGQVDAVKVTGGQPVIKNCIVTSSASAKAPDWSGCIAVYGGSPKIQGTTMSGSKGMGLLVRGGTPSVSGGRIEGAAIYGAWFSDGAGGTMNGTAVSGSGKSGVGIKGGASPTLSGNTITRNSENGIFVYQDGGGIIKGNTLSGNGFSGIEVGLGGKARQISDNKISGNQKHGIHVNGSGSLASVGANDCQGNRGSQESAEKGGTIERL